MLKPITTVDISPTKFYGLVEILNKVDKDKIEALKGFSSHIENISDELNVQVKELSRSQDDLLQQLRVSTKTNKNIFRPVDEQIHDLDNYSHLISNSNFLTVAYRCFAAVQQGYSLLLSVANDLKPKELILSEERFDTKIKSSDRLQYMMYEFQINTPTLNRFITALQSVGGLKTAVINLVGEVEHVLDRYYMALLDRHSIQGVEVFRDTIVTDIAISIYENVDSHGEIAEGKKADEVSAYTIHKAEVIATALKEGITSKLIQDPGGFIKLIQDNLKLLWKVTEQLEEMFKEEIEQAKAVLDINTRKQPSQAYDFERGISRLQDLDPRNIVYKEKATLLTAEERFNIQFSNETLKEIVVKIVDTSCTATDLIRYILERKAHLKAYFQDENSFYVCKIGSGNMFTGEAPGGLTVVPGQRPNVNLAEIIGSGFSDVKEFIKTIESSSQWHDLFLATSPSKTTDKSNVLLCGPMGCGKSEILRAVGGDKGSIGIFAQGSDFLTCWKGESEKNPKRLFEAGLKLQKESRKHVHFLIDEIDSILKKPEHISRDDSNLTLEFQILMDGVVHYPNLSVWGATNNPERIPMPMLRRFSKVLVVGELSQEDRINLLKQFINFLPIQNFNDEVWKSMALKLEGATGDVVRKVVDHVWRTKMTYFVEHHKKEAYELIDHLNSGEKFKLSDFDEKRKYIFKSKLGKFVHVNPTDLDSSIKIHLRNIAIRSEIETAKETYAKVKKFLDQLSSEEI